MEYEHQYLHWQERQSPTERPLEHGNKPVLSTQNEGDKIRTEKKIRGENRAEEKGGRMREESRMGTVVVINHLMSWKAVVKRKVLLLWCEFLNMSWKGPGRSPGMSPTCPV